MIQLLISLPTVKFPFKSHIFGNRRGIKKSIPKIGEQGGNAKVPFPKFGDGNKRLSFPGRARNGNYCSALTHTPWERW